MERIPLTRGATRWWSAPARFATAPLTLLRKTVLDRYTANDAWLHHAPVGIRINAELRSLQPR
jgi:hypothetical protein